MLSGLRADRAERPNSVAAFLESLTAGDSQEKPNSEACNPSQHLADLKKAASQDRRISTRFRSKGTTSCRPLHRSLEATWAGRIVNASQTGLCLELTRRFEPGTLLYLVVRNESSVQHVLVTQNIDRSHASLLLARVVWARRGSSRAWNLGCQFTHPLSESEIRDLCSPSHRHLDD